MSSSNRILVYGAGGHGAVIVSILRACGYKKLDIIVYDDNGDITELCGQAVHHVATPDCDEHIVAIGHNLDRWAIGSTIKADSRGARVIHPEAYVDRTAVVLGNTVVCVHANVGPRARVGEGCIINTGADVEHDAVIGEYTHLGPRSVVCGGAEVGEQCLIGAGAVILPRVRVPDHCVIGAGAVVTPGTKLRPDGTFVGVPARTTRKRK